MLYICLVNNNHLKIRTTMKTTLLLPNGFKKIGWAIFVPAFLLGCSICFFGENFDRWLFRETVMNNIAIIGTVVGALFIGFSREKIEDEMIAICDEEIFLRSAFSCDTYCPNVTNSNCPSFLATAPYSRNTSSI